jgi:AcrR family transcriptional regulator
MMVAELPKAKRKRSRQQRRASVTYHKLLNAARDVFSEKGMDLTRIDEITERADVGKGTFYYHFQSKEELIRELIKSVLGELEMAVEEKCRGVSELTGLVDTLIGAHIEFFSKRWEDFVLYFQGRAELNLQETYQGIDTPFLAYLKRIEDLIASVTRYRLPRPVLTRIACAAAGFVSGYYSFAVVSQGEDEDIDETLRSLRGAMVASLVRFITEAMPPGLPDGEDAIETTGSGAASSESGATQ